MNHLLIFNVFKKYSESSYHTDEYFIINSQFEGLNYRTKLRQQNIRVHRIIHLKWCIYQLFPKFADKSFLLPKLTQSSTAFKNLNFGSF